MIKNTIIITGEKGEGKTTKLLSIVDMLKSYNLKVEGFVALGSWRNNERSSYKLVDVSTGNSIIICTVENIDGYTKHGKFYFNPVAVEAGEDILLKNFTKKTVVVIDEVGPFELNNKVWHKILTHQLQNTHNILVLSVRKKLVPQVINKYKLLNVKVYGISEPNDVITKEIIDHVI